MRIDAVKFKAAMEASGKSRIRIADVAGFRSTNRIFQLETDGGEVNINIVAAMAKEMKVKPGDLASCP
jgi:hypothetical protein